MASPGRGSAEALRNRRNKIARLVIEAGSLPIEQIAVSTDVSTMTAYRDVAALEEMGMVTLTRGTVHALASALTEASASFRLEQNASIKRKIARAAAKLVPPGSSIMLDDSTTGIYLLDELIAKGPTYVVTNSLLIASHVGDEPDVTLQLTGGEYQKWAKALTGPATLRSIEDLQTDFCFLSASGISNKSCYHPYASVADIKRAMMDSAAVSVLLADHTKFQRRSVHRFAQLDDFDVIVTDSKISSAEKETILQGKSKLIVAQ